MGSEQFTRIKGIKRSAEGGQGLPEAFTVIGVDIEAEDLIARYKGTRNEGYAAAVIANVVQQQRATKGPPPAGFIDTLRGGVNTDILVCDLNADAKGKSWVVVVAGRQRTLGLRIVNAEAKAAGAPPMQLGCKFMPFSRKTAGTDANMAKIVENARVARSFSSRAEDAASLACPPRNVPLEAIAPYVEAKDADEVALLLALDRCEDEVKAAVDSGAIGLVKVKALAALDPIEQVRRVRRILSPTRKAADEAAPPRAKARPAKLAAGLVREFDALGIIGEASAVARWFAGDDAALAEHPRLLKALESARGSGA